MTDAPKSLLVAMPPLDFGSSVAGPAVAFAAKGGGKGKLSGGHWITVDTASGFRHLYIEGKEGSHGGRVLAGGGATPDNPKSVAEVTGHQGGATSGGEHLDHAKLVAIKNEVAGIGSEHGERGEFHHGPPKDAKEARLLDKAEAKGRHLVYSTIMPEVAERHAGESVHHDLGGKPHAVTMPNPDGREKGWVSRQFNPNARGGHDDVPHPTREAALKDSRGAVRAEVDYHAHTNSQYQTPKRLDKFFEDERTGRRAAAEGRAINVYRLIHRDKSAGAAFGSGPVAMPPVEFAAHREKLTGGRWVTIDTEDGGYRRLYIRGPKHGGGAKVIAGAGATLGHPKTLGEVVHPQSSMLADRLARGEEVVIERGPKVGIRERSQDVYQLKMGGTLKTSQFDPEAEHKIIEGTTAHVREVLTTHPDFVQKMDRDGRLMVHSKDDYVAQTHVFTDENARIGWGHAGPGGLRTFRYPYTQQDKSHVPDWQLHDLGTDPVYVHVHEMHHAFRSNTEFDHFSDAVAIDYHLKFGNTLAPEAVGNKLTSMISWSARQPRGGDATSIREARVAVHFLHSRHPDQVERAARERFSDTDKLIPKIKSWKNEDPRK